jgi:hypothetical protein
MMQKMLIIGLGVIGVIIAWLYVMLYLMFLVSPFSWSEADINKNGFLSPTEADYYGSYGKRLYDDRPLRIVAKESPNRVAANR